MDDVKYVVISHLHLDHTGYMHAFPNAKFLIMANELRYAYWPDPDDGAFSFLTTSCQREISTGSNSTAILTCSTTVVSPC